jgi:hypothetical protein
MSKLNYSYLRVVWQGEIYFVIEESVLYFPQDEDLEVFAFVPSVVIIKVESTNANLAKVNAFEVPIAHVKTLVSEIKTWLYLDTDL